MVKISGLIRRCSSLFIFLTLCIGINAANPTTHDHLLVKKDLVPLNHEELDKIYQYKLDCGIKNLSNVSAFLLRNSEEFIRQGDSKKAIEYSEYAQMLAPGYPPVYTNLGKAYWAKNRFFVFSVIAGWFKSLCATALCRNGPTTKIVRRVSLHLAVGYLPKTQETSLSLSGLSPDIPFDSYDTFVESPCGSAL